MTNTPPLSRIFFGLYFLITLAVGLAALIWPSFRSVSYAPVRDALLPDYYLDPSARIPVQLTIAAAPRLEAWAKDAAAEFSHENDLVEIHITALHGADANRLLNSMTGLPDAWIAESEFARTSAGGIPYQIEGASVAQDSFLWVVSTSRRDFAEDLDWLGVAIVAGEDSQFRVALPPLNSIEGMAACYSAAAEYHRLDAPTAAQINDPGFQAWMRGLRQAAPDLSRNPRDQLASRPPQADAGLILRSDWAQIGQSALTAQPPAYNVTFHFPYYLRSNWEDLPAAEATARREAAEAFRDYLTGSEPQDRLALYGMEKAGADSGGVTPIWAESTVRAMQFCWR